MVRSEHHQHDHEEEHIQMVVSVVVAIHHVEHKEHPEYGHFGSGSQKNRCGGLQISILVKHVEQIKCKHVLCHERGKSEVIQTCIACHVDVP